MTTRRSGPGPLTNIGTFVPPAAPASIPLTVANAAQIAKAAPLPPYALPIAQQEGETPGPKVVAEDPLWISRWQPSATEPLSKAPWVTGYRWWAAGVKYTSWGPDPMYRIDLIFKGGHKHAYADIPRGLWEEFRQLGSSVGQWFHKRLLGPGWKPGAGSLFPDWPIS